MTLKAMMKNKTDKTKMTYFEKEDILHLVISDESEGGSLELTPDITAELNCDGELIGIEILNASSFTMKETDSQSFQSILVVICV